LIHHCQFLVDEKAELRQEKKKIYDEINRAINIIEGVDVNVRAMKSFGSKKEIQ
jgi:hypothetical protein